MIIADTRVTDYTEVLDKTLLSELFHPKNYPDQVSSRYSIAHARLAPGRRSLPHTLIRSTEAYYILQGTGRMHVGEEEALVRPGSWFISPRGRFSILITADLMN